MIALEEQEGGQQVRAGGIAVTHGNQIGQGRGLDLRIGGQRLAQHALQRADADGVVRQLARQPMGQGIGEIVVLQHGVAYAVRHHAVMLHGGHRILAHQVPDLTRGICRQAFAA